jgi:hypothetical protein
VHQVGQDLFFPLEVQGLSAFPLFDQANVPGQAHAAVEQVEKFPVQGVDLLAYLFFFRHILVQVPTQ